MIAYHQRTKHSLQQGYAKGPETLDWDDQPNPFRHFSGCPVYALPKPPSAEILTTWAELEQQQSAVAELNLNHLGLLLELAFGISAWKQFGPDQWSVRNNPSSGNLHPTEVYVINTVSEFLPEGVYHYVSYDHHLEQRYQFSNIAVAPSLLIGFSSIHWREAWKYGERAFRYCQLDLGHALAALSYAAGLLGWRVELLTDYSDADIACLLGTSSKDEFFDKEAETADLLCRIHYDNSESPMNSEWQRATLVKAAQQLSWKGKAESLGAYHLYHWPVIDEVTQATHRPNSHSRCWQPESQVSIASTCSMPASQLIRQRRSAQHFNAKADSMPLQDFLRLLAAVLPCDKPPFNTWNWSAAVHLCFFVHNVAGLTPGLYCLPRSAKGLNLLQAQMNTEFKWQALAEFPELYLLYEANLRKHAKDLSCHQGIASDGVFSLAMLAEFNETLSEHPWNYQRLLWECGLIGQILYLEAEAVNLRGTGIGCFFDDDVHRILGIENDSIQSLYHFTVGEPIDDSRIQTLPAYKHLL